MRVLIIGAGGMLAKDLAPVLTRHYQVVALDHAACDITDEAALRRLFDLERPELVVNCAAYSDVDACERDPERAFAVNGRGPGNVARAAEQFGARVFHISTDYVFDGSRRTPYQEDDSPNPVNAYGRSKLDGERRVLGPDGTTTRHLILRTSWLYGLHRTNFVNKILEAAQSRPQVEAVSDQISCLTWTCLLAEKIAEIAALPITGILHIAGSGECSRYEIACRIVAKLPHRVSVMPINWAKLNLPAKRPAYTAMSSGRLAEFGLQPLPDWKRSLDEYLQLRQLVPAAK